MEIMNKFYDGNSITDIEEDVYYAINDEDLPVDDYGFNKGTFHVVISWEEGE